MATVSLQNVSASERWFGGYGRDFDHDFDCRFEDGAPVPLTRFGRTMVANRGLGKTVGGRLQPQESISVEVSLTRHLDLTLPGTYALVVTRMIHGTDEVGALIRSNRIELDVAE
jgi:hypothetical protein